MPSLGHSAACRLCDSDECVSAQAVALVAVAVELVAPPRAHRIADRFTKLIGGERREMVRYPLLLRALPSDLGTLTVMTTYRNMNAPASCTPTIEFDHLCWYGDKPRDEKVEEEWFYGSSPTCNGAPDPG